LDPVRLIVIALAAGATSAMQDGTSSAIEDTYARVVRLLRKRLSARPDMELILARYEEAPQIWESPLIAELSAQGARNSSRLSRSSDRGARHSA
jgi:hypothetical protein